MQEAMKGWTGACLVARSQWGGGVDTQGGLWMGVGGGKLSGSLIGKKRERNGFQQRESLDPPLVRMPLITSGTDIIFLVNYIISMWLKHSFNTTGKNSIQHFRRDDPPRQIPGGRVPPGITAHGETTPATEWVSTDSHMVVCRGAVSVIGSRTADCNQHSWL